MSRVLESVLPDSIQNEGLLFVPSILEDVMRGRLDRELPAKLPEGYEPVSERAAAFDRARRIYKKFKDQENQSNYRVVTRTFVTNLLNNALGWTLPADKIDNDNPFLVLPYDPESEAVESIEQSTNPTIKQFPIVIVPHKMPLDSSLAGLHGWGLSNSGRSATRFTQEFLNLRDDFLWAIVTNGRTIRLMRDNPSMTRPSYLTFDVEQILGGNGDFAAFAFMWRMLHGSRPGDATAEKSFWEQLRARSAETGVRALDGLRTGVANALQTLGTGFLRANAEIRDALQSGELTLADYEAELLHLAYRFLFLFVAEERDLLHAPGTPKAVRELYRRGYSMLRLRRVAARFAAGSNDRHVDLYEGVKIVFSGLAVGEPRLGLTALGGIFAAGTCKHLENARLANADLINTMRSLRYIDAGRHLYPVNYRDMGPEELGSVYEGLLELVPYYEVSTQTFTLVGAAGNNRKTSGSYYTPSSLVDQLIQTALVPVIEERMKAQYPEPALLQLSVIDPACGSGHFLVAAARKIANALVEVRGVESTPAAYQTALRQVVGNCIYGTDINPLAIELAKITLWIESVEPGRPLGFLDSHFVCGDATLGIDDIKILTGEIPSEAYKALVGDDKDVCKRLSTANRTAAKQVKRNALAPVLPTVKGSLDEAWEILDRMGENTVEEIEAKQAAYHKLLTSAKANTLTRAANLFTAAFLMPKTAENEALVPTSTHLASVVTGSMMFTPPSDEMIAAAEKACRDSRVLHWPLVFPTVFAHGGFDCVLGNPPWDQLQVSEEEFFASRDLTISSLAGVKRKEAIAGLKLTNPVLFNSFRAAIETRARGNAFINSSGRFSLSAVGKLNLYSIIAEAILHLRNKDGRAGFIVPSGICTDDSNKQLFSAMVDGKQLVSFLSFENENRIFADVHHSFKFALLTLGSCESADFTFFNRGVESLADDRRHFSLTADDFELINPNTRTAPIFRSKADAELAKKIYRHVGVFVKENHTGGNPWKITFSLGLFNTTTASNLFETEHKEGCLPLYEAKMAHQFDHRWATFDGSSDEARAVIVEEKQDFGFEVKPRYWVEAKHVYEKFERSLPKYFIGWRDITNAIAVRTDIATVIPFSAVADTFLLCHFENESLLNACLLGDMNSLVHDWCARQKVGGIHLKMFTKRQIATLAPSAYTQSDIDFIVPRVLELTYTSNSLKPWAEALGYTGEPFKFDPERRAILRAELDARYAKLYGLNEEELKYILDPSSVYGPDYPSESFRVLKEKEIAEFGEYRTMRLVLSAWHEQEMTASKYVRTATPFTEPDVRKDYLKFLIRQMLRETDAGALPISEIYSAWAALSDPDRMASLDVMPKITKEWATQYKDAIRDADDLEEILVRMCADKQISIARNGMLSLRNFPLNESLPEVRDITMDARLALTYCRKMRSLDEKLHARYVPATAFVERIEKGEYELAA